MRKSGKTRFARLGLLSIAILVSLCVMGIGYAGWMDTADIDGTMHTGYIEMVVTPGECSSNNISCSVAAPHTLQITLTEAEPDTYTCGFTITNTGTIPVKIQGIDIDTSGVPAGVDVSVTGVVKGTQIEQAGAEEGEEDDSAEGMVIVIVPENGNLSFSFDVEFSFIQWNLYEE